MLLPTIPKRKSLTQFSMHYNEIPLFGTHIYCLVFWGVWGVFLFFCFLGPYVQHMEVPRLGVKSELQLLAYTTATATQDPSHICSLHHSSQQCRILNPLIEARDPTCNFMDTSRIRFCRATKGTPPKSYFKKM